MTNTHIFTSPKVNELLGEHSHAVAMKAIIEVSKTIECRQKGVTLHPGFDYIKKTFPLPLS